MEGSIIQSNVSEQEVIDDLRKRIIRSLRGQGFRIRNGSVLPPSKLSKQKIRDLHNTAVQHRIEKAKKGLYRHESHLLTRMASGKEITPESITPRMVQVVSGSEDELLFRYACLHWSIPVSSGYGKRLRYLVIDEHNGKLIGLIGLGDPVFSLSARDDWIGWTVSDRQIRLGHVMDAFVLGAVPPYSYLLCGKLVAMLVASNAVRAAFKKKYAGSVSIIKKKSHDGRLAMITTTSALGRSSLYNRLKISDRTLFNRVGMTKGSGEFHFSNGLYGSLSDFANKHCLPTAKQEQWGCGFRNRREVVKKCLPKLGLSTEWLYHGIEREVYVVPLARNTQEFLCGKHSRLKWLDYNETFLIDHFMDRWLIPRSHRNHQYQHWAPEEWRLWPKD